MIFRPSLRGFKSLKPKEHRAFFKSGRVSILRFSFPVLTYRRFLRRSTPKLMKPTTHLARSSDSSWCDRPSTTAFVCTWTNEHVPPLTPLQRNTYVWG